MMERYLDYEMNLENYTSMIDLTELSDYGAALTVEMNPIWEDIEGGHSPREVDVVSHYLDM